MSITLSDGQLNKLAHQIDVVSAELDNLGESECFKMMCTYQELSIALVEMMGCLHHMVNKVLR